MKRLDSFFFISYVEITLNYFFATTLDSSYINFILFNEGVLSPSIVSLITSIRFNEGREGSESFLAYILPVVVGKPKLCLWDADFNGAIALITIGVFIMGG